MVDNARGWPWLTLWGCFRMMGPPSGGLSTRYGGDKPRYPRCGCTRTTRTRHGFMPHYCTGCHRRFSVRIGTVMESTRIGYRNRGVSGDYWLAGRLVDETASRLGGITQQSAWFLAQRLRESWLALADGSGRWPKQRCRVVYRPDGWVVYGDDLECCGGDGAAGRSTTCHLNMKGDTRASLPGG